jgi:hypothetical protein
MDIFLSIDLQVLRRCPCRIIRALFGRHRYIFKVTLIFFYHYKSWMLDQVLVDIWI